MIKNVQLCHSNEPYFIQLIPSRTQSHLIYEVHSAFPDDPAEEYVCSCPAFHFRGGCAHQTMAWYDRCLWTEQEGPEEQTDEQRAAKKCPRCGQDTYQEMIDDEDTEET